MSPAEAEEPGSIGIVDKMLRLDDDLTAAGVPYAFGGALALAWCTQQARGTIDIDLNLFVPPDQCDAVLDALAPEVVPTDGDRSLITRDGQARLWWDETPIDLFFNTTPFHADAAERIRREPFAGRSLPFLSCRDLAVFKAFFNRPKDWADLVAMHETGTLDAEHAIGVVASLLGGDDERVTRLRAVATTGEPWS